MTIDKNRLKALAEKATPVCEWYESGELRYADDKSGEIHGLHHDDDAFIAAANPAAILALLGEIERLESDAASMRGSLKAQGKDLTTAVRKCSRAVRELDQLKAENEALRNLVLSALEEGKGRPGAGGNAPGHCHAVPGVWDLGNGERSGTTCGWCRIWNAAQAMVKEQSNG